MDWSNERYVRLYTRNTAAWVLWPWQARALFPLLMRAADRAGVIDNSEGPAGVAALVMLPLDVAEVGLAALMKGDGAPVVETPSGYIIRNFLDAQEAAQSPVQRSRESRARRRDIALHGVTEPTDDVTKRVDSDTKRVDPDTDGHAASRGVTDGHSVPFCSVPSVPPVPTREEPPYPLSGGTPSPSRKRGRKQLDPTDSELDTCRSVLGALSRYSGIQYRGSDKHNALITRQLRLGRTGLDLRKVAWYCALKLDWKGKDKMLPYLRPETLFGPESIEKYLDAALTRYREEFGTDGDVRAPPSSAPLRVVNDDFQESA